MTRADILRRLAEAFELPPDHAERLLTYLRAIAREPGGAEAVAEALDLRAELECCREGAHAVKPPRTVIVWEASLLAAVVDAVDKGLGVSALPAASRAAIVESIAGCVLDMLQQRAVREERKANR